VRIMRMLDLQASHLDRMSPVELLESIRSAEGRTVAAEVIARSRPLLGDVSNPELAKAMGADLIILNMLDLEDPRVEGLHNPSDLESLFRSSFFHGDEPEPSNGIRLARALTGCPVGVNLEPLGDPGGVSLPPGRLATPENARRAAELGASFLIVTANPHTRIGVRHIMDAVRSIRRAVPEVIIGAGKMHAAMSDSPWGDLPDLAEEMMSAGADLVLIPCPGSVPSLSQEVFAQAADRVHRLGGLVMSTIGTSQEGSDRETIRQMALMAKMGGADVQHIGDSGYSGMAVPENIMTLSLAIRGRRHTFRRMARSIAR